MSAQSRRVNIEDLGEPASKFFREVQASGEEAVVVDGTTNVVVVQPAAETTLPTTDAEREEWNRLEREAWERIAVLRERISKNWTSPLSAAELVEEQRRSRSESLASPRKGLTGDDHNGQD